MTNSHVTMSSGNRRQTKPPLKLVKYASPCGPLDKAGPASIVVLFNLEYHASDGVGRLTVCH